MKALVAYATRTGSTQKIADLVAEGIRFGGADADVKNVNDIKSEKDLEGYDAYAFGSPTYHGDMMASMKTVLFLAEKAGLDGKVGASFGAYGWSGEAPQRIYETMRNIFSMRMVSDSLRLKSADLGGGVQAAQAYGKTIAAKLNEK